MLNRRKMIVPLFMLAAVVVGCKLSRNGLLSSNMATLISISMIKPLGKGMIYFAGCLSPVYVILNVSCTAVPCFRCEVILKRAFSSAARFFRVLIPLPFNTRAGSKPLPLSQMFILTW